jgi:cytochrome b
MPKLAKTDRSAPETMDARQSPEMTRVWDPLVRIFHWSLVSSFAVAWLTPHSAENIHHWAGYAAGALILIRLLWGILGTPYARFSQFVRDPKSVVDYLRAIISGREARHIGHNPAGGAMVLVLMMAMAVTAVTGWMMTTDAYYGEDWVENIHGLSADGLLMLVLIHVSGVMLASIRHRENLVAAMITGRKRKVEAGDVG